MMAPQIPYNDGPKKINSEDKFEAGILATCFLLLGCLFLVLVYGAVTTLWSTGILNFIVVFGILAGMFAIGRAVYHTILND